MQKPRRKILAFLWSTPRSLSTAIEKCMAQHPSILTIHEPYTDVYYFGPQRYSARYGNADGQASRATARSVNGRLQPTNRSVITFVKELAFQGEPFVSDRLLQRSINIILVRDPTKVAASLSKLKPNFNSEEFGYTALERLVERLERLDIPTLVVDGDDFRSQPAAQAARITNVLGLKFYPSMMHWKTEAFATWAPHESSSQARWHKTLESSQGFIPEVSIDISAIDVDPAIMSTGCEIYQRLRARTRTVSAPDFAQTDLAGPRRCVSQSLAVMSPEDVSSVSDLTSSIGTM